MDNDDWQNSFAQLNQAITVAGAQAVAVATDKLNRDQQKDALKWNQNFQNQQAAFAREQWEFNKQTTQENNAFNMKMAQDSFDFNKDYQLNKYQYTVQDAQKAGLNPLALGGMNAGSASVSGGNADVSGASGPGSVGGSAQPNPIAAALPALMSAIIQNQGAQKIANIEANAQKDVARITASSNRSIADANIRSQSDINARNTQNSLYLKALDHAHEMKRVLTEIAARKDMQVKDLDHSKNLEELRLSQQDKEFMTDFLFRKAESERNFFSDRQLQLLRYELDKTETMADVDRLIHDRRFDWAKFGISTFTDLLKTGLYFFKPF